MGKGADHSQDGRFPEIKEMAPWDQNWTFADRHVTGVDGELAGGGGDRAGDGTA